MKTTPPAHTLSASWRCSSTDERAGTRRGASLEISKHRHFRTLGGGGLPEGEGNEGVDEEDQVVRALGLRLLYQGHRRRDL